MVDATITDEEVLKYKRMQRSVRYFIKQTWGLVPQPIKEEYRVRFTMGLYAKGKDWDVFCKMVKPYWFEPFKDGYHLTWQQSLVLYGIDKAIRGDVSFRISIVSGHGIGKSMILSLIILWFLFVHPESQVACTSPGAEQMFDVLWKELKKWIDRMPKEMGALYEWQSTHIRIREAAETWFARAKTASKENTEALAGVHADWVMIAVDEASGVEEPIFETMEGALTSGNILVFLISNGTRANGYFYDTHHKDAERWQNYAFSSVDSPRVDQKYVDSIIAKYGDDSVQYAIRVKGEFPDEGVMDDKGFVSLFNEADLKFVPFDHEWKPVGRVMGALDPSGEGQDKSAWAVKDRMRAGIVADELVSSAASMAIKSLTVCTKYDVDPLDFVIDAFGAGHAVAQEIALATAVTKRPWRVTPINTGETCDSPDEKMLYVNVRAMCFYKMYLWVRAGGQFMDSPRLKDELLSIRFKRTPNGRIQIMSKIEMKKFGYASPNMADALSMLFLKPDGDRRLPYQEQLYQQQKKESEFDPHETMS